MTVSTKIRKVPVRSARCQGNKQYGENPASPGYRSGDSRCDCKYYAGLYLCQECPFPDCLHFEEHETNKAALGEVKQ